MGSSLQEILQGRGNQKGKSYWLIRISPLVCLIVSWLFLITGWIGAFPAVWFTLVALAASAYALLHLAGKRSDVVLEFLFCLALVVSGAAELFSLSWLKLLFFPFIVTASLFYGMKTVVPFALLLPLQRVHSLVSGVNRGSLQEELSLYGFILLSGIISSLMLHRLREQKKNVEDSLRSIEDAARDISLESRMESLSEDKAMVHYVASVLKTDEELRDLLATVKRAVFADSVNLFVPSDKGFVLRCSSDEKADVIITDKGMIGQCFRERKTFSAGDLAEKDVELGYLKNDRVSSVIIAPVLDEATAVAVLVADSARYQAFSEPEREIVEQFSSHIVRSFQRQRIYPKLKRDYEGLQILHEESSKLLSSLDIEVIGAHLCEGARKIAASQVLLFIKKVRGFELINHTGSFPSGKKHFEFRGTIVQMALDNNQTIYLPDVSDYRIPILPIKTVNVKAVIVVPIQYEKDLLGLCVMLSDRKQFADSFQLELIKVMCNQASTSIANAKLHGEIEKLATTDGLTGLFNHRLFQEKLSAEFKRQKRFSDNTSLLLTDIDFFKKINDTYGHPVGDLVLKGVSRILRESIRDIDVPARYGGEEFAVILPGTDGSGALQIAERLRKAVMNRTFSADGKDIRVTISIGIATAPSDAKHKEELIEKADQALYQAKHGGRNRSVVWSSMQ